MAKRKTTEGDEQLDLIDVHPENEKEIIACAKRYKKALADRQAALNREVEEKKKLKNLIEAAGLQRLDDGRIQFTVNGFTISMIPRDEKITVKEDGEE